MTQKTHTTNYFNTLIEVALDTKATKGTQPPTRNPQSIAEIQYNLIAKNPYKYTSDDILFQVFAIRNELIEAEYKEKREQFFSKGRPCFRTSPLTKTYGFGIHFNSEGKMALCGMETKEYEKLVNDEKIKKLKAMRSTRK